MANLDLTRINQLNVHVDVAERIQGSPAERCDAEVPEAVVVESAKSHVRAVRRQSKAEHNHSHRP